MPEATNLATWFWCVNFLNSGTIPYRGEGVECAIIYSVFKHFKCQALKHAILCFLLYASSEYTAVEIRTLKYIKSKQDSTLKLVIPFAFCLICASCTRVFVFSCRTDNSSLPAFHSDCNLWSLQDVSVSAHTASQLQWKRHLHCAARMLWRKKKQSPYLDWGCSCSFSAVEVIESALVTWKAAEHMHSNYRANHEFFSDRIWCGIWKAAR